MLRTASFGLAVAFLLTARAIHGQVPIPVGSEFQVNTYTTLAQSGPAIAMNASGNFVVVWQSAISTYDTSSDGILAQLFLANRTPVGSEFQVNTYTTGNQDAPAVAINAAGKFVVVWLNHTTHSLDGQRFDAAGLRIGNEFQIAVDPSHGIDPADVAMAADGCFVVVWGSYYSVGDDTSTRSVQGQRFASDGALSGSQFQVNTFTTDRQISPALAVGPGGEFVVAWQSYGSSDSDNEFGSIQGQRFAASGTRSGGEFQVNAYITGGQREPDVAIGPGGEFVVVWVGSPSSGDDEGVLEIYAQRFDADGSLIGGEFQVNTYTTGFQVDPTVSIDGRGHFVAAWGSGYFNYGALDVRGRYFNADGTSSGGDFQLNSYSTNDQNAPAVVASSAGNFVAVWQSEGPDGWSTGIQGQGFAVLLFADGFETGDVTAWSVVKPPI